MCMAGSITYQLTEVEACLSKKTIRRKMKVITHRTHSVTVYKPYLFTFSLFFSLHQQMDSEGLTKAVLLGVCPSVLCSLWYLNLPSLALRDTRNCLYCWAKTGPRKRGKYEKDKINKKGRVGLQRYTKQENEILQLFSLSRSFSWGTSRM